MNVYTDSEAQRSLQSLLEEASRDGEVRIQRKDGRTFVVRPESNASSPLDVEGVDLGITTEEIVEFVREGRRDAGT